jgi:hypothetical protein
MRCGPCQVVIDAQVVRVGCEGVGHDGKRYQQSVQLPVMNGGCGWRCTGHTSRAQVTHKQGTGHTSSAQVTQAGQTSHKQGRGHTSSAGRCQRFRTTNKPRCYKLVIATSLARQESIRRTAWHVQQLNCYVSNSPDQFQSGHRGPQFRNAEASRYNSEQVGTEIAGTITPSCP